MCLTLFCYEQHPNILMKNFRLNNKDNSYGEDCIFWNIFNDLLFRFLEKILDNFELLLYFHRIYHFPRLFSDRKWSTKVNYHNLLKFVLAIVQLFILCRKSKTEVDIKSHAFHPVEMDWCLFHLVWMSFSKLSRWGMKNSAYCHLRCKNTKRLNLKIEQKPSITIRICVFTLSV